MDLLDEENTSIIDYNGLSTISYDSFGRVIFSELCRDGQDLTDLLFIESFPNVSKVSLTNNHIDDLTPLQYLESLKFLNVSHNSLTDLASLGVPSLLEDLHASNNAIVEVSSNIPQMQSLRRLHLDNNQLRDVSIHSLPLLSFLDVSFNALSSLLSLTDLPELSHLDAQNNCISSPELSYLPSLTTLDLSNNPVSSLAGLTFTSLPSLHTLSLTHTHIHSFSALAPLTRLKSLSSLSLAHTPLSHTPRYRVKLLALFLSVGTVLASVDDAPVTPAELNAAQTLLPNFCPTTTTDNVAPSSPPAAPIPRASALRASERAVTATWLRAWELLRHLQTSHSRAQARTTPAVDDLSHRSTTTIPGGSSSSSPALACAVVREGMSFSLAQLSLSPHAFDAATVAHAQPQTQVVTSPHASALAHGQACSPTALASLDLARCTQPLARGRPEPLPHAHSGLAMLLMGAARECMTCAATYAPTQLRASAGGAATSTAAGAAGELSTAPQRKYVPLPSPALTPPSLRAPLSFSALHTLSLSHCGLGPNSPVIPSLAAFIASAPALSVLVLSHNHLGAHVVKNGVVASRCPALRALVPAAAVHGLASLDLSHNCIDDEGGELVSALVGRDRDPPHKTLRRLSLSHNPLGMRTAFALAHALAAPAGLRALELAVVEESSPSTPLQTSRPDASPRPGTTSSTATCAPLSPEAMALLLQGVARCPLAELDLSGQPLTDTAAHVLALALCPPHDAHTDAHANTSCANTAESSSTLPITPLLRAPALSSLALAHCGLSPAALHALATAIAAAPAQPLAHLDVAANLPGASTEAADAAVAALLRAALRANALTSLRADGLPLGPHALLALSALVSRHQSLTSLSLLAPAPAAVSPEPCAPEFAAVVLRPEVAAQAARVAALLADSGLPVVAVAQAQLSLPAARIVCDAWRPVDGPYASCHAIPSDFAVCDAPTQTTDVAATDASITTVVSSTRASATTSSPPTLPSALRSLTDVAMFRHASLPPTPAEVSAARLHRTRVHGDVALATDVYTRATLSLSSGPSAILVFRSHNAHTLLAAAMGDLQGCERCAAPALNTDAVADAADPCTAAGYIVDRGCTPQCVRERAQAAARDWRALAAGASGLACDSVDQHVLSPWPFAGLRAVVGRDSARCGVLLSRNPCEALRWAALYHKEWSALEAVVEVGQERVQSAFCPLRDADADGDDDAEADHDDADSAASQDDKTSEPKPPSYCLVDAAAPGVDPYDPPSPPSAPLAGSLVTEVVPAALVPLIQSLQASHVPTPALQHHAASLCAPDTLMQAVCSRALAPLQELRLGGLDAHLPLLLQALLTHPREGALPRNVVSPLAAALPPPGTTCRLSQLRELHLGEGVQWTVAGWRALCCLVSAAPVERVDLPGVTLPGTNVVAFVDEQMLVRDPDTGVEAVASDHAVNEAIAGGVRALLRAATHAPAPLPADCTVSDDNCGASSDAEGANAGSEVMSNFASVEADPKAVCLSLRGALLGDSGAWAVAQHLSTAHAANAPALAGLDLSGCGLGQSFRTLIAGDDDADPATSEAVDSPSPLLPGVAALGQALARFDTQGAVAVDLSDNALGAAALAALARGLAANKVVRKVVLMGNRVAWTPDVVEALAALAAAPLVSLALPCVVANSTQRLELSRRIFGAVRDNARMEVLELGGTYAAGLWEEEAQMLLAAVQAPTNRLKCVTVDREAVFVAFEEAGEGGDGLETEGEWALDAAMGHMVAQRVLALTTTLRD